jgi:DNA polymerase
MLHTYKRRKFEILVENVIEPELIVPLGRCALRSLNIIEAHQIELRQDVRKQSKWGKYMIVPMYHPGPRAAINRSTAEQTKDFSFLGELLGRHGFDQELLLLNKSL